MWCKCKVVATVNNLLMNECDTEWSRSPAPRPWRQPCCRQTVIARIVRQCPK